MSIAAFVPMKGHSERVPGKNVRPLAGRPLCHWVIDALSHVERVTTILVDTDSEQIAETVTGAFPDVTIAWRPDELRGDLVAMHDVLAHDATLVAEDVLLQTHSTNPLLRASTIDAAIDAYEAVVADGTHDSLFTVTPLHTRLYWPDGSPVNHDPSVLLRTQDLPPVHEENSCLYLFGRDVIEATGQRMGSRPAMHPIDAREAVDIDVELDFLVADLLMRTRLEAATGAAA